MAFVAQGTVQVRTVAKGAVTVVLNPISDYKVRHEESDYTVFVGKRNSCHLFPVEQEYMVESPLKEVLIQAAFDQVRVEIEIDKRLSSVTGVRVPVTTTSR